MDLIELNSKKTDI